MSFEIQALEQPFIDLEIAWKLLINMVRPSAPLQWPMLLN